MGFNSRCDGSRWKWTALGESGRSNWVKVDGPNPQKRTVLSQSGRKWTVQNTKVDGTQRWKLDCSQKCVGGKKRMKVDGQQKMKVNNFQESDFSKLNDLLLERRNFRLSYCWNSADKIHKYFCHRKSRYKLCEIKISARRIPWEEFPSKTSKSGSFQFLICLFAESTLR